MRCQISDSSSHQHSEITGLLDNEKILQTIASDCDPTLKIDLHICRLLFAARLVFGALLAIALGLCACNDVYRH